jgi:hypothetical protein
MVGTVTGQAFAFWFKMPKNSTKRPSRQRRHTGFVETMHDHLLKKNDFQFRNRKFF